MALVDGKGVEGLPLLVLGLDHLDEGRQVGGVLLGLGPLGLGQQLVGDAQLDGAADAEDAVVAVLLGHAGQGGLDGRALLGDQVVGSVSGVVQLVSAISPPSQGGKRQANGPNWGRSGRGGWMFRT